MFKGNDVIINMASVVFLQSCCLGNDTVVINYDVPVNGVSIEITVISIISLVIAGASSFGILCVLCSCGTTEEVTRRSRRYLVKSPSVNHVTKCLTAAGILANCGKSSHLCNFFYIHIL